MPLVVLAGSEDRITNALGSLGVPESWVGGFAGFNTLYEIRNLMDEAVLVPNRQTRYPPLFHVRVVTIGHMDGTPAAEVTLVFVIKPLESVQVMEIPGNACVFPVDFECVKGLVAPGIPG